MDISAPGTLIPAITAEDPRIRVPASLVVAATCILGWILHRWAPVEVIEHTAAFGMVVMIAGLGLCGWALVVLTKAGTDPSPSHTPKVLVETGPYMVSRNPTYMGLLFIAGGWALMWGDIWPWMTLIGAIFVLNQYLVPREEVYLQHRFGEAWTTYAGRVNRWF